MKDTQIKSGKQAYKMKAYTALFHLLLILGGCFLLTMPAHATGKSGLCGTANGGEYATAPVKKSEMCARGNATTATNSSGNWVWTCQGSGTSGNASCSAVNCGTVTTVNGACGSASGTTVASAPSSNLCNSGSATAVSGSGPWTWSCTGSGSPLGTTASCSANKTITTVNASCKVYASTYASQPASNTATGCNAGTYTDATDDSSNYKWTCNGSGSPVGSNANCTAAKAPASCLAQACPSTVTCTAGHVVDNTFTDPYDGTTDGTYDTTWSCTDGWSYETNYPTDPTDYYGQTFTYCGSNTPGFCLHRSNPATNGGPVKDYYLCQTQYGEEIFGYAPTWQKYIDVTPTGEKIVKNISMSYTPSDTVVLDQTQGSSVLTTYLSTAPDNPGGATGNKLWHKLYQSPNPIAMSGTCKPATPSPTCAATATCTYVNTTRVNTNTEYSTYSCDNGGNFQTPNYWYVGPTPYPSSRWYLAGAQITVPKNATTGGDTSCSSGPAVDGTCDMGLMRTTNYWSSTYNAYVADVSQTWCATGTVSGTITPTLTECPGSFYCLGENGGADVSCACGGPGNM